MIIGMAIVFQVNDGVGDLNRPPLIDPKLPFQCETITVLQSQLLNIYGSLTTIDVLQKTVREKIRKYRRP